MTSTGSRLRALGALAPPWLEPVLDRLHVDFDPSPSQAPAGRVAAATVLSVVGSLLADALIVKAGTSLLRTTPGYVHFQFGDYGKLTVVGVLIACAAWPVVTRITSVPRWLFLRMAVAVTLVLWLPDAWLLLLHQPVDDVAVLMVMHIAIAVVTYNLLVRVAPTGVRCPVRRQRARDPLSGRAVRVR